MFKLPLYLFTFVVLVSCSDSVTEDATKNEVKAKRENIALSPPRILTPQERDATFTKDFKGKLGILHPIQRAYHFADSSGENYLIFCERFDKVDPNTKDSIFSVITEIRALKVGDEWKVQKNLSDNIKANQKNWMNEKSIWFWTNYFIIEDLDKNGITDEIVVYGSSGDNGLEDGRIYIRVNLNGTRAILNHQNAVLDFERFSEISKEFYALPITVQAKVVEIMEKIEGNNQAIFPGDWKSAMNEKKERLAEVEIPELNYIEPIGSAPTSRARIN